MHSRDLIAVMGRAVEAIKEAIAGVDDWTEPGEIDGQYRIDLAADNAALEVLLAAGLGVLSEESGITEGDRDLLAVIDPVDGSTNASRGIPWYATSICVADAEGLLCALVVNLADGTRYEAARGEGATRNGRVIRPRETTSLSDAIVAVSGLPSTKVGWRQARAFGAAALEVCAVADGELDAFCEWGRRSLGVWDYLAGVLVASEAGAVCADAFGRELFVRRHDERRSPVAAATTSLLAELLAARRAGEGERGRE
ncbi:MAG: inositol monophosphatase family protein [Acidimicrobiales bacterium]